MDLNKISEDLEVIQDEIHAIQRAIDIYTTAKKNVEDYLNGVASAKKDIEESVHQLDQIEAMIASLNEELAKAKGVRQKFAVKRKIGECTDVRGCIQEQILSKRQFLQEIEADIEKNRTILRQFSITELERKLQTLSNEMAKLSESEDEAEM